MGRPKSRNTVAWLLLLVLASGRGLCWGEKGHELVARSALGALPKEIGGFYKANSRFIVTLSTLPDDWKDRHRNEERTNHYINLEKLSKPPFAGLVISRAAAEKRFGKAKLRDAGYLPWAIEERFNRLVRALRGIDKARSAELDAKLVEVVVQSALLAHYVADAHVPMHATEHYDGVSPEQKGIHGRWEVELLDHYPITLDPEAPEKVGSIRKSAFNWCFASFKQADAVFQADDAARAADPNRRAAYYQVLNEHSGTILKGRLRSAAQALAGVHVAAWSAAGKPKLPSKRAPLFWGK